MAIQEQLAEDLKSAMKAHDDITKDTIRLVRAAIKNAEIEKGDALDDEAAMAVLTRMAKQYRDSIETYRQHGRDDLVAREESEFSVLSRYLPEQLDEDAIRSLAQQAVEAVGATGPGDRGKVMGQADAAAERPRRRQYRESRGRRTAGVRGQERMAARYGIVVFPGTWSDTDWREAVSRAGSGIRVRFP